MTTMLTEEMTEYPDWLPTALPTHAAAQRVGVSPARIIQLANADPPRLEFVWTPLGRLFNTKSLDAYAAGRNNSSARRPPRVRMAVIEVTGTEGGRS